MFETRYSKNGSTKHSTQRLCPLNFNLETNIIKKLDLTESDCLRDKCIGHSGLAEIVNTIWLVTRFVDTLKRLTFRSHRVSKYWDTAIRARTRVCREHISTECFWLRLKWRPVEHNVQSFTLLFTHLCRSVRETRGPFSSVRRAAQERRVKEPQRTASVERAYDRKRGR